MKKHLIIASYDGISSFYCGPGTTIQDTLATLNDITHSKKIKISLAYVSVDPEGEVFNKSCLQTSRQLVKKTGGYLVPLCNGTGGLTESDMWQSFPQWKYLCASLATSLNLILEKDDDNVLMLHDTPFLLFHKFKKQIFDRRLRCFYMPRSSGLNHKFGDKKWRKIRVGIENEAFKIIKKDPTSSVLAIGKNFGNHLQDNYDISFTKKDYFLNGFYFGRYRKFLDKKFDISDLKEFNINIPLKSKIIFSWGRASIAKGQKEMLMAWKKVAKSLPNHYLVLQAPNNSGEGSYFNFLKKYEKKIPRTIIINDFNPSIWQTVLRTKNTDIVCIPSTMDPNPHTAIEAKLFLTGMDYVIISSSADGVRDTFTNKECLWVDPHNRNDFARKIIKATELDKKQRNKMKKANRKNLSVYDYSKTIKSFFKRIKFI